MPRSRKLVLAALAASAALAAGCGDGDDQLSDEEYTNEVKPILTTFNQESTRLGSELRAVESPAELQPPVEEIHGVVEDASDDLEAIEPPDDAADGHQDLIDAMNGYEGDLAELLSVVEGGDNAEIRAAATTFVEAAGGAAAELSAAREKLEAAGYQVGAPAPSG